MRIKLEDVKIDFNPTEESVSKDRELYLGGSDVAKVNSKASMYKMFKTKQENKTFTTKYTEMGHKMESLTKQYIFDKIKLDIKEACAISEEYMLRANCDGLIYTDNHKRLFEFKNNTVDTSYINIKHYIKQIHFYMFVFGIDKATLVEVDRRLDENGNIIEDIDNTNLKFTEITRNENIIEEIKDNISDWLYLKDHPNCTYEEFLINSDCYYNLDDIEIARKIDVNNIIRNKELDKLENMVKNKIKELAEGLEKGKYNYIDGDINVSIRKNKAKISNIKIYGKYHSEYIKYLNDHFYNNAKVVPIIRLNNIAYYSNIEKAMNSITDIDDMLNLLSAIKSKKSELKDSKEDEQKIKDIIKNYPNMVLTYGNMTISNNLTTSVDMNKFIEDCKIDTNDTDIYEDAKESKVITIKSK